MRKYYFYLIIPSLFFFGCTSSKYVTYQPAGSNEVWEISVFHSSGVPDNFRVVINGSTVIDEKVDFITAELKKEVTYKGKEIKLLVTHNSMSLRSDSGYTAVVLINDEPAGEFFF